MSKTIPQITNFLPGTDPTATQTLMEGWQGSSSYIIDELTALALVQGNDINLSYFAYNGTWYRCYFDVSELGDGTITSGSPLISSPTRLFTAADVGKNISVKSGGTSGATLNTTIFSVNTGTGVATMNANAGATNGAVTFMWGHDDTAAIQAAVSLSTQKPWRNRRAIKAPSGDTFISATIELYRGMTFKGSGKNTTRFRCWPGWTPGTGTAQYVFHAGNGQGHCTLESFGVDGSRDYYPTTQNLGGLFIDDLTYAAGGGYHHISCLAFTNNKGIAYRHAGGGENYLWAISGDIGSQVGFLFNTYDSHIMNFSFGGYTQTAVQFDGSSAGNRITNMKAWYSGGTSYPCMVVDGQTMEFFNLTIEEASGIGLQIQGTRSHFWVFIWDNGDVRYVNGNGGTSPVANRACIQIDGTYTARDGGIENYVHAYIAQSVRNTACFATSALRLVNNAGKNQGEVTTSPKMLAATNSTGGLSPGYAIAAVEIISSAGNNNIVVDGVTVN